MVTIETMFIVSSFSIRTIYLKKFLCFYIFNSIRIHKYLQNYLNTGNALLQVNLKFNGHYLIYAVECIKSNLQYIYVYVIHWCTVKKNNVLNVKNVDIH